MRWAEFGQSVSNRLCGVRHVHESDEQTLERMIMQARKTICPGCGGYGHTAFGGTCSLCHGTGERAYDPNVPIVADVMGS